MIYGCFALKIVQMTILQEVKDKQSFDLSIACQIQSKLQVLIFLTPIYTRTFPNPHLVDSVVSSNSCKSTVQRCFCKIQKRIIDIPIPPTGLQFPNECYRFTKWTRALMVPKMDNDPQIAKPVSLIVGTCPKFNLVKRLIPMTLPATIPTKSVVSKIVTAPPESRSL